MSNSDAWLSSVAGKLQADGFVPLPPQTYQAAGFKFATRRSRFELSKFGNVETFFVFADIPQLTPQLMSSFSSAAFQFAMRSKASPLPCGFFEAVFCFAVALASQIDPQTAQYLRSDSPPAHWGAGEIRAAFDAASGYLYYLEGTPLWGAAYHAGFRRQIQTYLG